MNIFRNTGCSSGFCPDSCGNSCQDCGNSCQNVQNSRIHFSGVGLPGNRIAGRKSHLLSNYRINLINSLLVSLKKLQKACLGSCSSFGAKKL